MKSIIRAIRFVKCVLMRANAGITAFNKCVDSFIEETESKEQELRIARVQALREKYPRKP